MCIRPQTHTKHPVHAELNKQYKIINIYLYQKLLTPDNDDDDVKSTIQQIVKNMKIILTVIHLPPK